MPKTTVGKWVQLQARPRGGRRQEITQLVIVASSLIINSGRIILMNKEETSRDGGVNKSVEVAAPEHKGSLNVICKLQGLLGSAL